MVNVDSYLRIYRWRGLTGNILIEGEPDPHETAVGLIQLAALTRTPSNITAAIPRPLYRVLTAQVDDRGITSGAMSDPVARSLFLSDLHDFLRLLSTSRLADTFPIPEEIMPFRGADGERRALQSDEKLFMDQMNTLI